MSINFGLICREELFVASCCREESFVVRICQKQACALLGWFLGSNEGLQIHKEIFLHQVANVCVCFSFSALVMLPTLRFIVGIV
jgi:hypothetical protein